MRRVDVSHIASIIVNFYRYIHHVVRQEITELDEEALNWRPGPKTNSIATLVIHLVGSEMEAITVARGLQSERDRPSEFMGGRRSREMLVKRLDEANHFLEKHGGSLTEEDLSSPRTRSYSPGLQPQLTEDEVIESPDLITGLDILIWNVAHAREHLGQLLLTKQLFLQLQESEGW